MSNSVHLDDELLKKGLENLIQKEEERILRLLKSTKKIPWSDKSFFPKPIEEYLPKPIDEYLKEAGYER